jgi:hypothetical protein
MRPDQHLSHQRFRRRPPPDKPHPPGQLGCCHRTLHWCGQFAVVAAAIDKDWTKKLVLLDPALRVSPERQQMVIDGQRYAHDHLTEDEVRAENPHWHPLDIEHRVTAPKQASRFALEKAVFDNADWNTESHAASLTMPTLVVGGDPAVDSMFTGEPRASSACLQPSDHPHRHPRHRSQPPP